MEIYGERREFVSQLLCLVLRAKATDIELKRIYYTNLIKLKASE
jgi:hypothetical protein